MPTPDAPPPAGDAGGAVTSSVFPGFDADAADLADVVDGLARRRRAAGLSQTRVAAAMGTSQSAVARLESGRGDPRMSTLRRYTDAVGCDLRLAVTPRADDDGGTR